MSAFTLVFQLFYVIRAAFREKDPETNETVRKWIVCPHDLAKCPDFNYVLIHISCFFHRM